MSTAIVEMKLDEYRRREDELDALRARVAKLEAACARAASYLEHDERHPELLAQLDAALKDAPQ